jgi:hypothetical protein
MKAVRLARKPNGVAANASSAPDPRFDLEPPAPMVRVWLFLMGVALPLGIAALAFGHRMHRDGAGFPSAQSWPILTATAAALLVVLVLLWWGIGRMVRRHRLLVSAHAIEIVTMLQRRAIAVAELDLAQARVVDLDERTELRPWLKTQGTALPGLRSGWFRLRDRRKAFVAMTGGPRVLWIPTRNGYDLLLQPRQPQALLARLREIADDGRPPPRT